MYSVCLEKGSGHTLYINCLPLKRIQGPKVHFVPILKKRNIIIMTFIMDCILVKMLKKCF